MDEPMVACGHHTLAEADTAAHWDGLCPICLEARVKELEEQITLEQARYKELQRVTRQHHARVQELEELVRQEAAAGLSKIGENERLRQALEDLAHQSMDAHELAHLSDMQQSDIESARQALAEHE